MDLVERPRHELRVHLQRNPFLVILRLQRHLGLL